MATDDDEEDDEVAVAVVLTKIPPARGCGVAVDSSSGDAPVLRLARDDAVWLWYKRSKTVMVVVVV